MKSILVSCTNKSEKEQIDRLLAGIPTQNAGLHQFFSFCPEKPLLRRFWHLNIITRCVFLFVFDLLCCIFANFCFFSIVQTNYSRDFLFMCTTEQLPFFDLSNDYNFIMFIIISLISFLFAWMSIRKDNDRIKSHIGRNTAHILKTCKDREII